MTKEKILELFIYSLDNGITEEENLLLETAMNDPWLSQEFQLVLQIRSGLKQLSPKPDPNFVRNVLDHIGKNQKQQEIFQLAHFLPIAAAASFALLLVLFVWIYFSQGNLYWDSFIGVNYISPDDAELYIQYANDI